MRNFNQFFIKIIVKSSNIFLFARNKFSVEFSVLKMVSCNYFIQDFSTPSDVSNNMRSVRFAPSETSDDINPVSLPRPKHRMA